MTSPTRHLPLAVAALATALALDAAEGTAPRIVGCDDVVRSAKRGVCANKLSKADFTALAPGVTWFYNWHFTTADLPPADLGIEYLPMVWGDNAASLTGLETYLATGRKPRAVLAINEPNLKDQAFITPEACAALYGKVRDIAAKHRLPVVGPHMALGSAPEASITAEDPIEKKRVTYTWFGSYLKAFAHFAGTAAAKAPVGVHSYKDIHELTWSVETAHKEMGGPVWVTEFAQWSAPNQQAALEFLMSSVDYLERTPCVAGYAWFKERANDHQVISLLAKEDGTLTALGEAYVRMPVHDENLYYRLPGRLQAERYRAVGGFSIKPTRDADGFADMITDKSGSWLDYNVSVEKAGPMTVTLRCGAEPGTISLSRAGKNLATATVPDKGGWQTISFQVELPAGTSTLRLQPSGGWARVNWIEFAR